ncbi:hypothetical protein B0A48_00144 [Cryoendolithus antarcticus]|uniref:SprT-like domain-containing protein n=1 Tax=Cryoendolithus antarcticus TaxID=1507870 RepID=A0A1V8TU96_9PEZI|nr:hypothetical protein B0A48_00144 [Cryoendolithus antarcticus]
MSQVKFEQKETIRTTAGAIPPPPVPPGGSFGTRDLSKGKEDLAHTVGNALTAGAGPNGYLAWYLKKLQEDPLRTKMVTSGSLAGLQEFLASWIAKDRSKHGHYFTSRVPKMAVYGAFISAPLGHVMISLLQRLFAGRTSLKAKILQIIVSNLVISPIQNGVYLTSMAVIAGARTFHQVRATVRAGFMPVMKVSWITSPVALAFAQAFLPQETWVPFFNLIGFIIGTYINAHTKKKRLQALRRKYEDGRKSDGRSDYDRRDDGRRPGRRTRREPGAEDRKSPYDISQDLQDPDIRHHGDLGWTLEYATAYCYKHIISNGPSIIEEIDTLRKAPAARTTPFRIFDQLDRTLFLHKLEGMVLLRWRTQSDHSPGMTSTAGTMCPRVTIELNSTPFKKDEAQIDDLLEQMIHQMIHAYFLICCGAQDPEAKQDGRLLDGVHFGVILMAIDEITRHCKKKALNMLFHASHRNDSHGNLRRLLDDGDSTRDGRPFIAIDPRGNTGGPPPPDGRSHCSHDNRYIRLPEVTNWQVRDFSRCIDLALDSKGSTIYDLNEEGKLEPTERRKGPPSATYIELIWDSKRVMIPREKAMAFPSLKRQAVKLDRFECIVPECEFQVFKCLWDFIQHQRYSPSLEEGHCPASASLSHRIGPPKIVGQGRGQEQPDDITTHIRVFKSAEGLFFEELRKYALERLFSMSRTTDDPIAALKELYNDKDGGKGSIHADLHKWARAFLARTDDRYGSGYGLDYTGAGLERGLSNYEILLQTHRERFEKLYHRNAALKDDCKLVVAEMTYPGRLDDNAVLGRDGGAASTAYQNPVHAPLAVGGYAPRPLLTATPYGRRRSYDDLYNPTPALLPQPIYAPANVVPLSGERLAIMPPSVVQTPVIAAATPYWPRRHTGGFGRDPVSARYRGGSRWRDPWATYRYM